MLKQTSINLTVIDDRTFQQRSVTTSRIEGKIISIVSSGDKTSVRAKIVFIHCARTVSSLSLINPWNILTISFKYSFSTCFAKYFYFI